MSDNKNIQSEGCTNRWHLHCTALKDHPIAYNITRWILVVLILAAVFSVGIHVGNFSNRSHGDFRGYERSMMYSGGRHMNNFNNFNRNGGNCIYGFGQQSPTQNGQAVQNTQVINK